MSSVTIYHNPRCSKSREALALLQASGVEIKVRDYLNDAPTVQEIHALHTLLSVPAHNMLRTKEAEYALAGLQPQSSDTEIYQAISAYPKLLERPIIIYGKKAIIARPPEKALEIIS